MNSPASLRDLYIDPSTGWSFSTPPPAVSNSTAPPPEPPGVPPIRWTTRRPARNSIFDLSPDLNEDGGMTWSNLAQAVGAAAVIHYTSSAIAMPWEVGKLLLQVQWVPRESQGPDVIPEPEDDEGEMSDSSNDNDSYFADPESTPRVPHPDFNDPSNAVRRSVLEDGSRPEYTIPVGSASGVWGMINRLRRFSGEGWLALWKGLLTSCVTEILSITMQPVISATLESIFLPPTAFSHPSILIPITSHLITGFILSPLDLIRTRLIVQASSPRYRSYTGPIDAFSQILRDEGGFEGIYLHPNLLIPTIIDNTLRPFVSLALPSMLTSYFGLHITEDANPIAWGFAELAGSCVGLVLTLPFETIRRRLQVQVRGTARPIKGCVELRPVPYNGVVDAAWRILTEERSDLPITRPTRRRRSIKGKERADAPVPVTDPEEESWKKHTGLGQLYRGMGMRLGASIIVFMLALVSGEGSEGGWAEL